MVPGDPVCLHCRKQRRSGTSTADTCRAGYLLRESTSCRTAGPAGPAGGSGSVIHFQAFGQELFAAGQKAEGQISEVGYLFPKPGPDKTPVPKVSFVTRVGDIYCGVGYYK
jgi:hypothetical protein